MSGVPHGLTGWGDVGKFGGADLSRCAGKAPTRWGGVGVIGPSAATCASIPTVRHPCNWRAFPRGHNGGFDLAITCLKTTKVHKSVTKSGRVHGFKENSHR